MESRRLSPPGQDPFSAEGPAGKTKRGRSRENKSAGTKPAPGTIAHNPSLSQEIKGFFSPLADLAGIPTNQS